MNFGNSAYGIGQRRPVNNASSFAPIRSGGGGGGIGIDDNFRGNQQSMNYGRVDSFSNNSGSSHNNNNSGSFGNNNNSQRFTGIDGKFGSMQSNNYGRSSDNLGYSNQRFGNTNRGVDSLSSAPSKSNYNENFRGQQPQQQSSFMGRPTEQRFNMSDNNRAINNLDYSAGHRGNVDNYRGPQATQQQQQAQLSTNLHLGRSVGDLGFNDSNQQRFYNNDRNDTFRRADNFNDNFRGQESNNSGRTGSTFKFNNGESFGRSNNSPNFGGYMNNSNNTNSNRSFDDNFQRGQQANNNNFDNNKNKQQYFNNNNNNNKNNMAHTFRAINNAFNTLMTSPPSNWQAGNSNNNIGQGNFNNRNNNPSGNRNFNNAGPSPNGNWPQQQQQPPNQQGKVFKPPINRPQQQQQASIPSRKPPAVLSKFQGNRSQNQPKPNTSNSNNISNNINNVGPRNKPSDQANKRNININTNNKQQQPVAKNINGGQKPQPKAAVPPPKANVAAQNTQAKPSVNPVKPEIKKEAIDANPKVGQKRPAPPAAAPPTKADIKRRKLALKRGFLIGGFKLPYVNNNKVALPQPEDKSYAVMFFEQALNYSTSGEELDDDETAAPTQDYDAEGKNAGRTLVKRIRKRLHFELTQLEESKKYKSWQSWWTDYKWCEKAIQEQLDTFGSINLRECFIPDLPRLTTEEVVDVIVKQAQFGLEKNSDNYFNNMKSILTLMNITFLENLDMPNTEKVQDMIRAVPNDFWSYKMRSMVYLWAQYLKISKTSSPSTETGVKELQAIARDWKNPLFHWIAKQAFDELKAISEVEWPEHKQQYEELESSEPTS
ncbi:hypothetical protein ACLKA7_004538 [Drosophila subpalustris]